MRTTMEALRERRAARAARILVTGATGFLGSHITVALLRSGYRVAALVRPGNRLSAGERVSRLLDWFGLEDEARRNLRVIAGDIGDGDFLRGDPDGISRTGGVDEIVHCASNTSFAERKRAEVEAANVGGLGRVLEFAARSGCGFFHHLSTAYVAGKRTGICREEFVETGGFTNVYEETKARGELLVRDLCRREGIRLNVYRPSIVYGDSRTGRTLRFNAVYFPVKTAVFLRDIYTADIRDRGGKKAAELGVQLEEDGTVHMPIRIEVGPEGGVNLIPVDYFTDVFLALMEDGAGGGIYHIVNSRLKRIEDIIGYARRHFGLTGIEACLPGAFAGRPKTALETLFETYLDVYRPYMQDLRTFEIRNAAPVIARKGLFCPEFDEGVFARCMDFAVATGWGSRLVPNDRAW